MSWKFVLYEWFGWNVTLFQEIYSHSSSTLTPLISIFGFAGNYWTAPLMVIGLWLWSRSETERQPSETAHKQLIRFIVAFGLAVLLAALLKLTLSYPRPAAVLGDLVRHTEGTDLSYGLPSGHSTYAALVAGALWPLAGKQLRVVLVLYPLMVGWARIAAGMHFPADVLAGWSLGLVCLTMADALIRIGKRFSNLPTSLPTLPWYGLAFLVMLTDQFVKLIIVESFVYGEQTPVTSFFNLVYVLNPGSAFSFLADAGGWQRYFFIALALGISGWLMCALRQGKPGLESAGYSLVLGGALGNMLDRILQEHVVDFLDFHWHGIHWPAFNFADVGISLGATFLVLATFVTGTDRTVRDAVPR